MERLTVNIQLADGWDFYIYDAVFVVDGPGEAAEAWHVDGRVQDGEEGELMEQ